MEDVRIPDSLLPTKLMHETAKKFDENFYPVVYKTLVQNGVNESRAIDILSAIVAERISLCIGVGISSYDKKLLRNIIERHIAEILCIE